jgi:hypothetical protein
MPRFTEADYKAFLARSFKDTKRTGETSCENESELQQQIAADIKRRGWVCFFSRMDRKTSARVGTPDFVIALENGRTLYLECKTKRGKVSESQAATIAWLRKLSHHVEVVASFQEYQQAVEKALQ